MAKELTISDPGMASLELDTDKPASLEVQLIDSEWIGSVQGHGEGLTLRLDGTSSWTVTEDCTVGTIELESGAVIAAERPVTVRYQSSDTVVPGTYGNVTFIQY